MASAPYPIDPARHRRLTARVVAECAVGFAGLLAAGIALSREALGPAGIALAAAVVLAQGCWMHRLYLVGHEAVHFKLVPWSRPANAWLGQALLLPILVPLGAYRKIHLWHHGHNRRDVHTAALDTWVLPRGAGPLRRAIPHLAWYTSVFLGGFFVHSLVTLALFLALPVQVARRVHPAYRGWRGRDRAVALLAFAGGIGLHAGVALGFGGWAWALSLGLPFAVFAVIYSWFAYMFHYDAGFGPEVRAHVRSLAPNRLWRWWLVHFNEHATHHADASVPWYALPERAVPPDPRVPTVLAAVLHQLRGPVVVERSDA
jgi:fatty acid desaturase